MNDDSYTITGRQYSKILHWNESSTEQEISAAGGFSTPCGAIEHYKEKAAGILKAQKLPYSAVVYYVPGTKQWQIDPPPDNQAFMPGGKINPAFLPHGYIDVYLKNEANINANSDTGKAIDVLIVTAARILTVIEYYENNRKDPFMLAYELGRLSKLLEVYSVLSSTNKQNRKDEEKETSPFIKLAEKQIAANHDLKHTHYWPLLKLEMAESDYYSIEVKGTKEYLHFYKDSTKVKPISRTTYETNYIAPARRRFLDENQ